jgi:hypothetical protein
VLLLDYGQNDEIAQDIHSQGNNSQVDWAREAKYGCQGLQFEIVEIFRGKYGARSCKFAALKLDNYMEEPIQEIPSTQTEVVTAKHIVVFGKHDYIVENAQNLLNKGGYTTSGFVEVAGAIEFLKSQPVDAVFMGGGVDPHDRIAIKAVIDADFQHVKIIDHFGGPATILTEAGNAFKK